ncbi:hypothetical protein [Anaerobacillus alkaliphilus]|nr:hypothetical protein [Anaerobacillus alkaliphilus]
MSLLLVFLFISLIQLVSHGDFRTFINGIIIFNLITFLLTAMPFTYPRWFGSLGGHPSDGLQLLRLLRET